MFNGLRKKKGNVSPGLIISVIVTFILIGSLGTLITNAFANIAALAVMGPFATLFSAGGLVGILLGVGILVFAAKAFGFNLGLGGLGRKR